MNYDRQLILTLGGRGEDTTVRDGAWSLAYKHAPASLRSEIFHVGYYKSWYFIDKKGLKEAIDRLTGQSRLYILGHGDWHNQKLEDWEAKDLAELIGRCNLRTIRKVSVVSCSMGGRNTAEARQALTDESINDFGLKFFFELGTKYQSRSELFIRCYDVAVDSQMRPRTIVGKLTATEANDWTHKRQRSKIRWRWIGDAPEPSFVVYKPGEQENEYEPIWK